jgi:TonB family protein
MRLSLAALLLAAAATAGPASAAGLNFAATTLGDLTVVAKLHPLTPPPPPPGQPAPPPRYYPERAQAARQEGHAVLRCDGYQADGAVTDCKLLEEGPPGWGFGDAALGIVRVVHLAPKGWSLGDNAPSLIPFVFRMESDAAGPAEPYTVVKPNWTNVPDTDLMARLIRREAPATKPGDWALVECAIDAAGALQACTPLTESTPALAQPVTGLAARFRMATTDQQGHPVADGRIRLLVRFIDE